MGMHVAYVSIYKSTNADAKVVTIIHIVPNGDITSGGLAYASIRLAHEQARIGLNVSILEIDSSKRVKAEWWSDKIKYLDANNAVEIIKRFYLFRKWIVNNQVILHFHGVWYPRYLPFFLLAITTKTIFVISPHGNFEAGALRQKFLKKYIARKIYFNRVLSRASALWACSEKERSSLKSHFPKVRVDVVPIGVDIPNQLHGTKPRMLYDGRKIMLVISRLNEGKGLINLINAWDKIRDEGWIIIIAGPDEGNFRKKLEKTINQHNLNRFFILPGYINPDERSAYYRGADFFVLPSLSENFGIVVVEAMSHGIPVLTTNETPWEYVGIERGCFCVGTSSDELAAGLRVMMNLDGQVRQGISQAARSFVVANFNWPKVAKIAKEKVAFLC